MATPNLEQASRRSQQESRLAALDSLGSDRSEFLTEQLLTDAELAVGEFIERVKSNMDKVDLIVTGKITDMRIEHDTKENKINIVSNSPWILYQDRGVNGSEEKKYSTPHEYTNLRPPSHVFEDYIKTKNIQLRHNENYDANGGSPFSDMDGDDKAIESAAYGMATTIFKEGFKPQKFFAVEIPKLITDLKKVIPNFVISNIVQQINAKASDQLFTGKE
jgi:hypothetical protein